MSKEIEHGDKVKDKISGFKGIVVAITTWFNGCVRITVQPDKVKGDGTLPDGQTFDSQQIEVLKKGAIKPNRPLVLEQPQPSRRGYTGGPTPEPSQPRNVG